MEKLPDNTLVFLVKRADSEVTSVCLTMKKRGFGQGRWNGVGGKVEEGETIEEAAKREAREEIGIELGSTEKIAELTFTFPAHPDWDRLVTVYFCDEWRGEFTESEEMAMPQWFAPADVPYDTMWAGDRFWISEVLKGDLVRARFSFGGNDTVLDKDVQIVQEW